MFLQYAQKIIGIDFSDYSIEMVCLRKGFLKPKLYSYARVILPPGVMSDGKILQSAVLSEVIRKMVKEARPNTLKPGYCIVSLPDSQVFSHVFKLPTSLRGQKLRQAIIHEAHLRFPSLANQMYYDFIVSAYNKDFQEVIYFAASRSIINEYVAVLRDAGFIPVAFDVESLSLARSLLDGRDSDILSMIIDIGARYANISVYKNHRVVGVHIVPSGGYNITARVARDLYMTKDEAEDKKKKIGLTHYGEESEVSEIAADELKQIIREIKKIIQYYLYRRREIIENIILTGGTAMMPGIQKFFQSHFWQEVQTRNPLEKLNLKPNDFNNGRKLFFANVIGLAMRGLHDYPNSSGINLLHKSRSSDINV